MTPDCVCGIDPGLDGGIAFLRGGELLLHVTPTLDCKGGKRTFDLPAMRELLVHGRPSLVAIERASARPGQGVTSMFSFGMGYGIWLGMLAALGIPCEVVPPKLWKQSILVGTAKDKQAAIQLIQRRFPDVSLLATPRCRKPHDGLADSAVMALHARQLLNGR